MRLWLWLLIALRANAAPVFDSAPVADECPKSVEEWSAARAALENGHSLAEVLAFGERVKFCKARPEGERLFKNPDLARCLTPLEEFADLVVEDPKARSPIAGLNARTLPESVHFLPKAFQDSGFWTRFASKDERTSRTAVLGLAAKIPGSITFRYRSQLQPKSDLYLTIFREGRLTRFVHYDRDQNVNLLTFRDRAGDAHLSFTSVAESGPRSRTDEASGRCFRCHQSAVLAIVPLSGTRPEWLSLKPPRQRDPVLWFNEKYALREKTGYSALFHQLPAIGADARPDMSRFVSECFHTTDEKKVATYREAMKCALCHNDREFPALRWPFGNGADLIRNGAHASVSLERTIHQDLGVSDRVVGTFAVPQLFVESGHMPPDFHNTLSAEERKALVRCLLTDVLGGFYPEAEMKNEKGRLLRSLLEPSCLGH